MCKYHHLHTAPKYHLLQLPTGRLETTRKISSYVIIRLMTAPMLYKSGDTVHWWCRHFKYIEAARFTGRAQSRQRLGILRSPLYWASPKNGQIQYFLGCVHTHNLDSQLVLQLFGSDVEHSDKELRRGRCFVWGLKMPATWYGGDSLHPSNVVHIKTAGCLGASLHLEKKKYPLRAPHLTVDPGDVHPAGLQTAWSLRRVARPQVMRSYVPKFEMIRKSDSAWHAAK